MLMKIYVFISILCFVLLIYATIVATMAICKTLKKQGRRCRMFSAFALLELLLVSFIPILNIVIVYIMITKGDYIINDTVDKILKKK